MLAKPLQFIEAGRIREGQFASSEGDLFGAFFLRHKGVELKIVSSGAQDDWEHVSVSTQFRCPTWDEMCVVKKIFFGPGEVVMQLHPAEQDYVNLHPYCLHLWRPVKETIPLPDVSKV